MKQYRVHISWSEVRHTQFVVEADNPDQAAHEACSQFENAYPMINGSPATVTEPKPQFLVDAIQEGRMVEDKSGPPVERLNWNTRKMEMVYPKVFQEAE